MKEPEYITMIRAGLLCVIRVEFLYPPFDCFFCPHHSNPFLAVLLPSVIEWFECIHGCIRIFVHGMCGIADCSNITLIVSETSVHLPHISAINGVAGSFSS